MDQLTIAICTHNRANILKLTLPYLIDYWQDGVELLLIDNASTDNTKVVFEKMSIKNARYIYEPQIGLSIARNRAIQEAQSNWIIFLDDDAKILPDTISKAIELTNKYSDYGMIGGVYTPWYIDEKPKWIPDSFGSNLPNFDEFRDSKSVDDILPTGNIMLLNKQVIKIIGQFMENLGMKGENIGYGEETDIAIKAINHNIKVGIEPNWRIEHLVASYKFKLSWQLNAIIEHGKADEKIENSNILYRIFMFLKSILGLLIKKIPIDTYKLFRYINYKWQNFIFDSLKPTLYYWGRLNKK